MKLYEFLVSMSVWNLNPKTYLHCICIVSSMLMLMYLCTCVCSDLNG